METFFIVAAILSNTGSRLLTKYILKSANPFPLSFLNSFISSLIFLPLAIIHFEYTLNKNSIIALGCAGILWTVIAIVNYHSYQKTDLSIREPVTQTRILFALFLGVIFLGEPLTTSKLLGTCIIFTGLFVLFYKKGIKLRWHQGTAITLGVAFLIALVSIFDKYSLQYFSVELYGFIVYVIPLFFMSMALPKRAGEIKQLLHANWKIVILASTLSATAYYFILRTFEKLDITIAYPLLQLTTFLTALIAIYMFNEKENISRKIIATIIIILGTVLLKLS